MMLAYECPTLKFINKAYDVEVSDAIKDKIAKIETDPPC